MASDNVFSFAIAMASPKGGTLEQMLANTTNCYKYVWMLALLRIASENKREFVSFKEMTARMVAAAWYPVIYFRLNLGYSDQLAELIYAVREECHLPDDSSYDDIVAAVMGIQNPDVEKKIRMMTRYVPQRFIAAVFNDQYAEYRKEFGKSFESKKDNLTRDLSQKAMNAGRTPYVISKDGIQLTPEWTRYFIENNPIITECTYFKLTQFLQQKNPSVPAISEKLIQPTSRNSLDFSFLCGFFIFQSPDAIFFPQMQRPVVHIASGEQNVSGLAHTLTLHDPACIGHTHKPCGAGNLLEWVGCSLLAQVVNQQNADAILISKLFQCTGLLIVICIHSAVSIAYTHFLKRIDDNQANIAVCMNQRFYLFL